jgi:hypothetical protein
MCPQQLDLQSIHDHKPHNHPRARQKPSQKEVVTGDHKLKMLASTVQFSTNTQPPPQQPQHTHPTTQHHQAQLCDQEAVVTEKTKPTNPHRRGACLFFQDPTGCPPPPPTAPPAPLPPQNQSRNHGCTRPGWPLSVMTRQCLRHRAPPPHIRRRRAPHPFSREGAP